MIEAEVEIGPYISTPVICATSWELKSFLYNFHLLLSYKFALF